MELLGKNVLFFAPPFFDYWLDIKKEMEICGMTVKYYNERPSQNSIVKALIRLNRKFVNRSINKYYYKILKNESHNNYNFIFIIDPESIDETILMKMRLVFKDVKLIGYCWDSIKNKKNIRNVFMQFDYFFSFDQIDAIKHKKITFLPLFYGRDFQEEKENISKKKYDICIIATGHSDRLKIINSISKWANINNLKMLSYIYFPGKLAYFYTILKNLSFNNVKYRDTNFKSMSRNEVIKRIHESRVVLDIQHPSQQGLTMRSIECLGMEKKIITTNENIKKYDFYSDNNILIIDRNNINIDKKFITTPYLPIDDSVKERYKLNSWIKEIFREQVEVGE